jgi:hypothetical protein
VSKAQHSSGVHSGTSKPKTSTTAAPSSPRSYRSQRDQRRLSSSSPSSTIASRFGYTGGRLAGDSNIPTGVSRNLLTIPSSGQCIWDTTLHVPCVRLTLLSINIRQRF